MTYRDSSPAWVDAALAKLAAMPRYSYRLDATERVGRYSLWWHGVYAPGHGLVIATTNWERYAVAVRRCCALHAVVPHKPAGVALTVTGTSRQSHA